MKKLRPLLLICLLCLNIGFAAAQFGGVEPTQFDTFIKQLSVEWAAYVDDYVAFERKDFNKILLLRLAKNEIKASLPVRSNTNEANYIRFDNKNFIDSQMLYSKYGDALFDSLGNIVMNKVEPYKIDTATFIKTEVTQILYIENDSLKSYVPWISPMIPIKTSDGTYVGEAEYFSTCFNYDYDHLPNKQSENEFLGQTKLKVRLDTIRNQYTIKELYGRTLVTILWSRILANKLSLFSVALQRNFKPQELCLFSLELYKGQIFVLDYPQDDDDDTGRSIETERQITAYQLIQDWYYDRVANIVTNKIREVFLYTTKLHPKAGETAIASPEFKIIFQ